ncbi:hypothetical protein D3C71_1549880 [compost metagenome]
MRGQRAEPGADFPGDGAGRGRDRRADRGGRGPRPLRRVGRRAGAGAGATGARSAGCEFRGAAGLSRVDAALSNARRTVAGLPADGAHRRVLRAVAARKRHRVRRHHRRWHGQRGVRRGKRRFHRAAGRLLRLHGWRLRRQRVGRPVDLSEQSVRAVHRDERARARSRDPGRGVEIHHRRMRPACGVQGRWPDLRGHQRRA